MRWMREVRYAAAASASYLLPDGRVGHYDVEHGVDGDASLCGISRDSLLVMRHPFWPGRPRSCSECERIYVGRHGED